MLMHVNNNDFGFNFSVINIRLDDKLVALFMADKGRISELSDRDHVIAFQGLEGYEKFVAEDNALRKVSIHIKLRVFQRLVSQKFICACIQQLKGRDFHRMYRPTKGKDRLWRIAVTEAELLQNIPVNLRIRFYSQALLTTM